MTIKIGKKMPSGRFDVMRDGDPGEMTTSELFDGKTLDGWEGDPTYWRVESGSLVGEITPERLISPRATRRRRGRAPVRRAG